MGTQVSVNNRFGNSLPVDWTIAKLKSGEIIPRELPLIRVAKYKGKFRSVDNRRLYCFRQAGIKQIPVCVIKEDRKMKQLFEKNKSKNNGTSVYMVDVPLNPKNLDTKVITYDPTGERKASAWTVRQAIEELEGKSAQNGEPNEEKAPHQEPALEPLPALHKLESMETTPECELGEIGELDNTIVSCGEIVEENSQDDGNSESLQKEGSADTDSEC